MMKKPFHIIFAFMALAALAACTSSSSILDLNGKLIDLYGQELAVQNQGTDDAALTLHAIKSQYLEIMNAAGELAPKQGRTKTAISLYRIAATAAWRTQNRKTINYASDGLKICNANTENSVSTNPRDCTMLAIFPHFAAQDEAVTTLEKIKSGKIKDPTIAENLARTFLSRLKDIRSKRKTIVNNPQLVGMVDKQMFLISCNAWKSFALAFDLPDDYATKAERIDTLRALISTKTGRDNSDGCPTD